MVEAIPSKREKSHERRQKKKCHTQQPTTVSTTTTTKAPDTSVCFRTARLNSTTGAYLKTICQPVNILNQTDANDFCNAHAMKLLALTDAEIVNSLVNYLAVVFKDDVFGFVLNAIKATSTSNWVLYSDMTTPVYSGFDLTTNSITFPVIGSFWLNPDGSYLAYSDVPSVTENFICEFI